MNDPARGEHTLHFRANRIQMRRIDDREKLIAPRDYTVGIGGRKHCVLEIVDSFAGFVDLVGPRKTHHESVW